MISEILYKLQHSAEGIWSAHVTTEECRRLLDYVEGLESKLATLAVEKQLVERVLYPPPLPERRLRRRGW